MNLVEVDVVGFKPLEALLEAHAKVMCDRVRATVVEVGFGRNNELVTPPA